VPHVFDFAPSGRAKCRGCSGAIAKGALRFGERLPNPFAEGEMTLWFHPECAAYKRPESLLETLDGISNPDDRARLEVMARFGVEHRRLPRIDGAELSPGSQAKCRHCREPIEKGSWRIRLVFFEDGLFSGGGFIHLHCHAEYFETSEILNRVLHFSSALSPEQTEELKRAFEASAP
jgi:hypothetical protein